MQIPYLESTLPVKKSHGKSLIALGEIEEEELVLLHAEIFVELLRIWNCKFYLNFTQISESFRLLFLVLYGFIIIILTGSFFLLDKCCICIALKIQSPYSSDYNPQKWKFVAD